MASTIGPSEAPILERARSLCNEAVWTVALQRTRLRSSEPEDAEFVFRKWADFRFLRFGERSELGPYFGRTRGGQVFLVANAPGPRRIPNDLRFLTGPRFRSRHSQTHRHTARLRCLAFPAREHAAGARAHQGLLGHIAAVVDLADGQSAPRTRHKSSKGAREARLYFGLTTSTKSLRTATCAEPP
jgi:hypothetical protein